MSAAVAITVQLDPTSGRYLLMATSHSRTATAGPRILRGAPHPDIAYDHGTQQAAESDAVKLRNYFAALPRKPSKKKLRQMGS